MNCRGCEQPLKLQLGRNGKSDARHPKTFCSQSCEDKYITQAVDDMPGPMAAALLEGIVRGLHLNGSGKASQQANASIQVEAQVMGDGRRIAYNRAYISRPRNGGKFMPME